MGLKDILSFAYEKLEELRSLKDALQASRPLLKSKWSEEKNLKLALLAWETFSRVHSENPDIAKRLQELSADSFERKADGKRVGVRANAKGKKNALPLFPTTTIGSFPQTHHVRKLRNQYRKKVKLSPQLFLHLDTKFSF